MTFRQFFFQLFFTILLSVGFIQALAWQFEPLKPHVGMAWWTITLFTTFSIMFFMWGKAAIASANKYLFTNLTLASVFMKMLLGLGLVVVYKKRFNPTSDTFVVPFFVVYLIFTVFETWFMVRLTKVQK